MAQGVGCDDVKVIYSARESYLDKETSIWVLQWNETCQAYQFDFLSSLFGPRVDDAKVLKEQADQVLLDDQHGVKYWIQPLASMDGFGRDVPIARPSQQSKLARAHEAFGRHYCSAFVSEIEFLGG